MNEKSLGKPFIRRIRLRRSFSRLAEGWREVSPEHLHLDRPCLSPILDPYPGRVSSFTSNSSYLTINFCQQSHHQTGNSAISMPNRLTHWAECYKYNRWTDWLAVGSIVSLSSKRSGFWWETLEGRQSISTFHFECASASGRDWHSYLQAITWTKRSPACQ